MVLLFSILYKHLNNIFKVSKVFSVFFINTVVVASKLHWNLRSRTWFVPGNCSRSHLFENWISLVARETHDWHTGFRVKGLLGGESRPEANLGGHWTFFPWTTWSKTKLFENQNSQELRFDCPGLRVDFVSYRSWNAPLLAWYLGNGAGLVL